VAERAAELRNEIEDTREHLGDTLDAIGDRVSPGRIVERRKNRARQSIDSVRERVMGAVPSAPSMPSVKTTMAGPRDAASGTMSSVSEGAHSVVEGVKHAPEMAASGAQGNPLVAGGIAFGLGVLVASLLPTTEAEASVAGSVVEPVKEQATEIGKEVASTAKDAAAQAGQEAKQAVSEAATAVKDEASSKAEDVKQTASDAAGEIASTAQEKKDEVAGQR
jgi:hypothetical protein